jgi:hypothetical protein
VLDANTTPWRGNSVDYNWGWRTNTSDALFVIWHRVDPAGWISTRYGALVQGLEGGLTISTDPALEVALSEIPPPAEQHFAFMARPPDADLVDATFAALQAGDVVSRRLATAID